mmetsp:Transcript_25043/g.34949  ORF Transcript_25043/g.34949 Transcript_25043/m.34949 type:complete len:195 (+) Transcript_25043:352-936(+)
MNDYDLPGGGKADTSKTRRICTSINHSLSASSSMSSTLGKKKRCRPTLPSPCWKETNCSNGNIQRHNGQRHNGVECMCQDEDDLIPDSHFNMRNIQQQLHFKLMPKLQDDRNEAKCHVPIDGQPSPNPTQSTMGKRKMHRDDEAEEVDAFNFLATFLTNRSLTHGEEFPGVLEVSERSMKIMDDIIACGTDMEK